MAISCIIEVNTPQSPKVRSTLAGMAIAEDSNGNNMVSPYFTGETLDDIMRWVIESILREGQDIHPTKGPAKELAGVLLELTNPLARISRTETKGKPFSCLGELLWYLAGTKELSFISYYLREYNSYADGEEIFGGYGPRFFDWNGINQFFNVIDLLKVKPDSRQAVIQLFDAQDILEPHKDIPCTCTIQLLIRNDHLHMFTYMRSNDAFIGLPHDFFCFTMLQEIMANALSVKLGCYKHMVGSLHLYHRSISNAQRFLDEGWQPTQTPMPTMPKGDPWPAIRLVLDSECLIRTNQVLDPDQLTAGLDAYWADLIRLLLVFRAVKDKDFNKIRTLRARMSSPMFNPFIDGRIRSDR